MNKLNVKKFGFLSVFCLLLVTAQAQLVIAANGGLNKICKDAARPADEMQEFFETFDSTKVQIESILKAQPRLTKLISDFSMLSSLSSFKDLDSSEDEQLPENLTLSLMRSCAGSEYFRVMGAIGALYKEIHGGFASNKDLLEPLKKLASQLAFLFLSKNLVKSLRQNSSQRVFRVPNVDTPLLKQLMILWSRGEVPKNFDLTRLDAEYRPAHFQKTADTGGFGLGWETTPVMAGIEFQEALYQRIGVLSTYSSERKNQIVADALAENANHLKPYSYALTEAGAKTILSSLPSTWLQNLFFFIEIKNGAKPPQDVWVDETHKIGNKSGELRVSNIDRSHPEYYQQVELYLATLLDYFNGNFSLRRR